MLEVDKIDELLAMNLRETEIIIFLRYFFDVLSGVLCQSICNLR